ncbi:uncharacterized protein LOC62_02G003066 [Vanrija pseudolonga]|uniref:GAR domain-containing protein n=1 Tax=Vanrija pseudolonga TaxID=143232 RepID=A0AAF1BGZ8_9TREE|nr:hypothetical protein LOC62_02G003066 [Vanrija pseudolonga]
MAAPTAALAEQVINLSLDDDELKRSPMSAKLAILTDTSSTSSPPPAPPRQHTSHASISSVASLIQSEGSSSTTPNRPPRSPLRRSREGSGSRPRGTLEFTTLMLEIDNLQAEVATLLDKIYEIEELRHSPSARSAHAARLDTLLSEADAAVDNLTPRIAAVDLIGSDAEVPDLLTALRADWAKATAQHYLVKQELQEDPWLVRFRTTAEQAEGMMDPLQTSLVDLTSYVGRIFSSLGIVPQNAADDRLSMERLRSMAVAHGRLKSTYVPSVNKILRMMEKSVADRSVKNGEALRRLNDMTTRWATLQKQLVQLDAKVALCLSQHDHDEQHHEQLEELDDDHLFLTSPKMTPVAKLEPPKMNVGMGVPLQRVLSAGASSPAPGYHGSSRLGPPSASRPGSITPSAAKTLRRSQSRPSLGSSLNTMSPPERPRWNMSTRPFNIPPHQTPPPTIRRPSSSSQGSVPPVPSVRRPVSPWVSSPEFKTPRKSMPAPPPVPAMPGSVRSVSAPRPSLGASLGRAPPPSAFRNASPAPTPTRPSSRLSQHSNGSHSVSGATYRPFVPSKYDLLDQEVQKVLDAVQPGIIVARIDQPLRRGQLKNKDEPWTGEFLFGAGERTTSVKLLELASRSGGKKIKSMVRAGGAWLDLGAYLQRKKEERAALDDDVF